METGDWRAAESLTGAFAKAVDEPLRALLACPPSVKAASRIIAESLADGGITHLFGSGHSSLVVRDVVSRAGGLAPLNQMIDYTSGMAEPLDGYADLVVRAYDEQYELRAGEVMVIVSHSGANPLPVGVGLLAKERGLKVVGVLALAQSEKSPARHSSGLRLHEVADVVIDTGGVFGDALVTGSATTAVGPGSGILGTVALQMLVLSTCDALMAAGVEPPVFKSKHLPGARKWNEGLRVRYRGRLRRTSA